MEVGLDRKQRKMKERKIFVTEICPKEKGEKRIRKET
jgi:hypothetical protein